MTIFWILGLGVVPFIFGVYSLMTSQRAERYAERQFRFYGSILLMAAGLCNFLVGILGLTNPEILRALDRDWETPQK